MFDVRYRNEQTVIEVFVLIISNTFVFFTPVPLDYDKINQMVNVLRAEFDIVKRFFSLSIFKAIIIARQISQIIDLQQPLMELLVWLKKCYFTRV